MRNDRKIPVIAALAAAAQWFGATRAGAEPRDNVLPKEMEGLAVVERFGTQVPADLVFRDQDGRTVALGGYLNKGRPVVLTFNYTNCPLLCHLQLQGFVDGLREIERTAGKDFEIVTVILDPQESPPKARATWQRHMAGYRREEAGKGWHFLTGREPDIKAAADAVGFPFRYIPARNEYVHPAAIVFLTQDGKVNDYLYGATFDPKEIDAKLTAAAQGKVGSPAAAGFLDDVLMWCYYKDPADRSPSIMKIMRTGAILSVLAIAGGLGWFWRRELRGRRDKEAAAG